MLNKIIMNKKFSITISLIVVAATCLVGYYFTHSNSVSGTVVEVSALNTTGHGVKIVFSG